MLRISASKCSGNPEALPSQSRPDRVESETLRFVGPAGIGAAAAAEPDDALATAAEADAAAMAGFAKVDVSVGKRAESLTLPRIHFWTRWMY